MMIICLKIKFRELKSVGDLLKAKKNDRSILFVYIIHKINEYQDFCLCFKSKSILFLD